MDVPHCSGYALQANPLKRVHLINTKVNLNILPNMVASVNIPCSQSKWGYTKASKSITRMMSNACDPT